MTFKAGGDRPALAYDGRLSATANNLDVRVDGSIEVVLGEAVSVGAPWLLVNATALPLAGMRWSGTAVATDLIAGEAGATARIGARVTDDTASFGSVRARRVEVDIDAGAEWREGWLRLDATAGSYATLTGITAPNGVRVPGPLSFRLANRRHHIAVDPATGRLDGGLALGAATARLEAAAATMVLGFDSAQLAAGRDGRLTATIIRPGIDGG
ncbi:MAG: hypothetical protein FJX53_16975, partial [Alphaproteobacteria bacterium]|nr:hypothetical protein [Alphaproteobacteria bacterium]